MKPRAPIRCAACWTKKIPLDYGKWLEVPGRCEDDKPRKVWVCSVGCYKAIVVKKQNSSQEYEPVRVVVRQWSQF
jgi:hypothetical protein